MRQRVASQGVRLLVVAAVACSLLALDASPAGAILVPGTPTNVVATPINGHAVNVMWSPGPPPAATHFIVQFYDNSTLLPAGQNWCPVPCTSMVFDGLNANRTYTVWVWAANGWGWSLGAGTAQVTTLQSGAPDPVISATATPSSSSPEVTVAWTLSPTGEPPDLVEIKAYPSGGGAVAARGQCDVDPSSPYACDGATSEVVVGLTPGHQYFLHVRAANDGAWSVGASTATFTVASGCAGADPFCLAVDGSDVAGSADAPASGLVHSALNGDAGRRASLQPSNWRVHVRRPSSTEPYLEDYEVAASTGASMTVILSSGWQSHYSDRGDPNAHPPWRNENGTLSWSEYRAWVKDYIRDVRATITAAGLPQPDYWDVLNEPDNLYPGAASGSVSGYYFDQAEMSEVTLDRILEWFEVTYDAVQELEAELTVELGSPVELPLLGPSLANFRARPGEIDVEAVDLATFLGFSADHDLDWAGISWHENASAHPTIPGFVDSTLLSDWTDNPVEQVANHVAIAEELLAAHPSLGALDILINEYGPPDRWELPGYQANMLAAVEAEGVHLAAHACFKSQNHADNVDHCFESDENSSFHATYNGQVDKVDGVTPYPIYWVSQFYAAMSDGDADVVASNASHPTMSVFATRDDDAPGTVSVVVGRIVTCLGGLVLGQPNGWNRNCAQAPAVGAVDVPLHVTFPYAAPFGVDVVIERIPYFAMNGWLLEPEAVPHDPVQLIGGQATITLDDVADGTALTVTLSPRTSP